MKPWRLLTFEEEVWRAFEGCISAGRIMEQESIGTQGSQHFESRPSIEAFDVSVTILESLMDGGDWMDDVTTTALSKLNGDSADAAKRFSILTRRLRQVPSMEAYFRKKRPKWTIM